MLTLKEPKTNETIVIYRKGNETIAHDKTTGKKAVAKCCPDDTYNFYAGAKLALDRLIPYIEVKRLAKAGEYVKIVKTTTVPENDDGTPAYKVGDILKIIHTYGNYARFREGGDRHRTDYILNESEYVVLEGYQPPKEEKKLYNGKVVCVKAIADLTQGKIYEFKDGKFIADDGAKYPSITGINDFEDLKEYFKGTKERTGKRECYYHSITAEFIEIVE